MLKKLIHLAAAFALAVSVFAVTAGPVAATIQGPTCTPGDPEKVLFYENKIADTSDGNDAVWFCGGADANLQDNLHTVAGNCHGFFFRGDWNDCASSVRAYIPSDRVICIYAAANYSPSEGYVRIGSSGNAIRYDFDSGMHDQVTSWRFKDFTLSC